VSGRVEEPVVVRCCVVNSTIELPLVIKFVIEILKCRMKSQTSKNRVVRLANRRKVAPEDLLSEYGRCIVVLL
jgi:hypothetical protein